MADFRPLLPAREKARWERPDIHAFIRSQFRIESFMLVGALVQGLLSSLLPARYALLPAACFVLAKVANVYAMKTGLIENPHMKDAIMSKFSAQFPDSQGAFGTQPARAPVCVFLIGARSNSPLGMLDPNFIKLGKYFEDMLKEVRSDPSVTGFLGGSSWTGAERDCNASGMNIMYFRSADDVHRYAHGPKHREGWNWWNKHISELKELSIFHELYEVPSGNYESIYEHMPPLLAAATQHRVVQKTEQGEQVSWVSPVVDAEKGQLKSSKGRMARSQGQDNDKYDLEDGLSRQM